MALLSQAEPLPNEKNCMHYFAIIYIILEDLIIRYSIYFLGLFLFARGFRQNDLINRNLFQIRNLSEELKKLAQILQELFDGVVIADSEKVLYMNKKAQRMIFGE